MFQNVGPKHRLVTTDFILKTLPSIVVNHNPKIDEHLSEETNKRFVDKINKIAEYVRSSKYIKNNYDAINDQIVLDRMILLAKRANNGILHVLVESYNMPTSIDDDFLDDDYKKNKKHFEKIKSKLTTQKFKNKLLNLPFAISDISDIDGFIEKDMVRQPLPNEDKKAHYLNEAGVALRR